MPLTKDTINSNLIDALLCDEDGFSDDVTEGETYMDKEKSPSLPLTLSNNHVFSLHDDDDCLASLISKERGAHFGIVNVVMIEDEPLLKEARQEAVSWILMICAHYSFDALISVLAVNYFDRFIQSLNFLRDKPWMTHLAAIACLNVALKMEDSQVSHLLDLQVRVTIFFKKKLDLFFVWFFLKVGIL